MLTCPRNLVWPVVVAVGAMVVLVAAHTLLFAPAFSDFYDAYIDGNGAVPVPAFTFYRGFWAIGPALALVVLVLGAALSVRARVPATHLAWYASLSAILAFAWLVFTLTVERILFSQYGLPA